jgi:phenylacetate-CoA ligase
MGNLIEKWLHDKIKEKAKEESEFRHLLGKETLDQVKKDDVEKFHLFQLRKILSYVYEKSPFYREHLTKNGIKPDEIRSLNDLALIPFTEPSVMAESPYRFLCLSMANVIRPITFTSSGTTGPQKKVFFTGGDIEKMVEFMEIGMRTVAKSGDRVQIILPGGAPLGQLDLLARGVERMGGLPIKAGTALSPEEQLELIQRNKPAVLFGSVRRMYRISQELLLKGYTLNDLGVKTLFLTSEYLSESMRERLQRMWNCEVSLHYGLTEMGLGVAVECTAHNGFHFNEVDLLLEVINPETGELVKDDGEGELVFTTLNREAMPLIRYRTHDIAELITEPCPCGAGTLLKFGKVTRRLESIVRLRDGDEIYPALLDEVLYKIPQIVDYEVILREVDGKDDLSFVVEVTKFENALQKEIRKALSNLTLLQIKIASGRINEPKIDLVALGQLKQIGRAKKMIVDNR